ncbi:hypothetical protein EMIT07CA2_30629 [Brevibacillus sp. IT-7CA2]
MVLKFIDISVCLYAYNKQEYSILEKEKGWIYHKEG